MGKKVKKFKGSMFGYSKEAVDKKIERLEEENIAMREQLKKLQEKIVNIQTEYQEKYRLMEEENARVEDSKKRIAEAYIEAQKTADNLLEKAKDEIAIERHKYEVENEVLKDIIVERKEAIRNIRLSVQSFGSELEEYFGNVIKSLSSDINTAVKQLDYEHLEKIASDLEIDAGQTDLQQTQGKSDKADKEEISDVGNS